MPWHATRTTRRIDELGLLQMEDWAAMARRLKGYSLAFISIYSRCDPPSKEGANARRLAEVAKFTKSLCAPLIIA